MIYLDKRPLHPSERIKRLTKNKKTSDVEFVKKILPHLRYKLRAREQIQDDISKNIPVENREKKKMYLMLLRTATRRLLSKPKKV